MNSTSLVPQTFADILSADKQIWETVVTINDSDPVDIRFAKELADLSGKVIALAVVMTEKPHTWFFDCSQTFTADIAPEGCEMTFSYNPWNATEGKYVEGKVTLTRRPRKKKCVVKYAMSGIPEGEMEVYTVENSQSKNLLEIFKSDICKD